MGRLVLYFKWSEFGSKYDKLDEEDDQTDAKHKDGYLINGMHRFEVKAHRLITRRFLLFEEVEVRPDLLCYFSHQVKIYVSISKNGVRLFMTGERLEQ